MQINLLSMISGWAATIKYNTQVRAQLQQFYAREDTFSLGVCNGCQLMGLMGWVAPSCGDGRCIGGEGGGGGGGDWLGDKDMVRITG